MFAGEKTDIFWLGLIILALASVTLFAIVWFNAVALPYRPTIEYQVPFIVGAVVFVIVGLYMMTSGIRQKNST